MILISFIFLGYLDQEEIKATAKELGLPETFDINVKRFPPT